MQGYKIHGKSTSLSTPLRYLISFGVYVVSFAVMFAIGALIINMLKDPLSAVKAASYAALILSAAVSGTVSSRIIGKGAIGSLICGSVVSLLILVISFTFAEGEKNAAYYLVPLSVPLVSFVSALVLRKKDRRDHHRSMYKKFR